MTTVNGTNAAAGVQGFEPGMGIEEMMMLVQAQRADNLEKQMADQIKEIQSRNEQVGQLNNLLSSLRADRPSGDNPDKKATYAMSTASALADAGVTGADKKATEIDQKTIDTYINDIKGKIDSLNSTGQLDMIRMQSLMNKRNEAFDTLSNLLQKVQKTLDSIVGNMR
ncbi:hypothetical protein [Thalassospira lucentensis]|uniref:hypothetical protein n=1 Tax=Thalassospira lucentensis TaxID=168935 RepID=UPI00142D29C6|nr:hypothetical protein [Thalassospira lucentensis]NIZ03778.1 hypothetical protein [Thalassospira lucentensis]